MSMVMDKLNKMEERIREIEEKLVDLHKEYEERHALQKFKFSDFVQELIGAAVIALPFSVTEEVWELAQKLPISRVLFIYFFVTFFVFIFIRYSKLQNWEQQNVAGFIPLRLITSMGISFLVSLACLLMFGIYPDFIKDIGTLLKATLLVNVFAVIGSLGVDMAK